MKTFSIAEAQANLPDVLEKVKAGQDVGIISGNQIIQLKPISVVAWEDSYLCRSTT
jgi:antitoxin (DNA-binding transcriptional repressor) of toxin-antitoxin stability system